MKKIFDKITKRLSHERNKQTKRRHSFNRHRILGLQNELIDAVIYLERVVNDYDSFRYSMETELLKQYTITEPATHLYKDEDYARKMWQDKDYIELEKLYDKGLEDRAIASIMNRPIGTITLKRLDVQTAQRLGVQLKSVHTHGREGRNDWTDEDEKMLKSLFKQGYKSREISILMGKTYQTVSFHIRELKKNE